MSKEAVRLSGAGGDGERGEGGYGEIGERDDKSDKGRGKTGGGGSMIRRIVKRSPGYSGNANPRASFLSPEALLDHSKDEKPFVGKVVIILEDEFQTHHSTPSCLESVVSCKRPHEYLGHPNRAVRGMRQRPDRNAAEA
ncbi:unnamed protein product [Prunus armeniaca]